MKNYTQFTILPSRLATVNALVSISLHDLDGIARHAVNAEHDKQQFELSYDNLTAVLHKTFTRKMSQSGNVTQYENLDRSLNAGIVNLFSGMQYEYDHNTAIDRLTADLTAEYTERVNTALINGKSKVNIINRDRLLKMYRDRIDTAQNATYQSDTLPISLEVVHDIFVYLLSNGISVTELSLPYEQFRDKYSRIYARRETVKYKNKDNITVTDNGIFSTNEDGNRKCKYRFKSKQYTHVISKYNVHIDNTFIPFTNTITIHDRYTITDKWIYVDTSKSVYDMIYTMCNTFIERERRSYTGQDNSFDNTDNHIDLPYIEKRLDEIVTSDTFIDLVDVLTDKCGMKRMTANKFVKAFMLIGDGYTQKEATAIVGIYNTYFSDLKKRFLPVLVGDYSHLFV